jgi:hypothetical protein
LDIFEAAYDGGKFSRESFDEKFFLDNVKDIVEERLSQK